MSWKVLSESDPFDRWSTLCTKAEYRIKTNEKYLFSKKKLKFVFEIGYSGCDLVFYFSHLVIPYCWKYSFSMKALSGHFRTALIVPRKWYLVKREITRESFISFDNGWKKVLFPRCLRFFSTFNHHCISARSNIFLFQRKCIFLIIGTIPSDLRSFKEGGPRFSALFRHSNLKKWSFSLKFRSLVTASRILGASGVFVARPPLPTFR